MKFSVIVAIPIGKVDGEFPTPIIELHAVFRNRLTRAMA